MNARHDHRVSDDVTLHPRYLPGEGIPFDTRDGEISHAVVVDIAMPNGTPSYRLANVPGRSTCWVSFAAAHAEADRALAVPA